MRSKSLAVFWVQEISLMYRGHRFSKLINNRKLTMSFWMIVVKRVKRKRKKPNNSQVKSLINQQMTLSDAKNVESKFVKIAWPITWWHISLTKMPEPRMHRYSFRSIWLIRMLVNNSVEFRKWIRFWFRGCSKKRSKSVDGNIVNDVVIESVSVTHMHRLENRWKKKAK